MHLLAIICISYLISQSAALIRRQFEKDNFLDKYERDTINEVSNSIYDAQQSLANYNFYGDFYEQADDGFSNTNARKSLNGNQKMPRTLNEIEEEIKNTKSTENVERVVRGFVSDLEYFKGKLDQSFIDKIGDHVVLVNVTKVKEYENKKNNLNNTIKGHSEEVVGHDTQPYDQNDEIEEYNGRRVYRGQNSRISEFPFMASVHVMGQFYCAGSVIASSLVITAASCLQMAWDNRFFRDNPKFLFVRVGSTFYNAGGEFIQVLEVYFHPYYDPNTLENNLAILRLRRRIRKNTSNRNRAMKILYDTNAMQLPLNTYDIIILGWGAKEIGNKITNPMHNRLSYASLDMYGLEDCQDIYSKEFVTKKHFCAGFITKGGGACSHDVGAPGLVDGILTGVASFGAPLCGARDAPTVFTKLGFYKEWIENIKYQVFYTMKKDEETFVKELAAIQTTKMINRTPYLYPKIKELLKKNAFLSLTTTPNYDRDPATGKMLPMSIERPAIADQSYNQEKHYLSENQAKTTENIFQLNQELKQKNNVISTTITETLLDKPNYYLLQNNLLNATGEINNILESFKIKHEKYKGHIQKQIIEPKHSFIIDMIRHYKEENQKTENKQKDNDKRIDKSNQKYIKNIINNVYKQSNRETEINMDHNKKKLTLLTKYSEKADKTLSLMDPIITTVDLNQNTINPVLYFNPKVVKEPQLLSDLVSERLKKMKRHKYLDPHAVKEKHLLTGLEVDTLKNIRHSSHVDVESMQTIQFSSVSEFKSTKNKNIHPELFVTYPKLGSIKKIKLPHLDKKRLPDVQHLIKYYDTEIVETTQRNENIKHLSSEYDPSGHKTNKKYSLDKKNNLNKEEKRSSDSDPERVALGMLDTIVDGLYQNQDIDDDILKNNIYYEYDESLPENMFLSTEYTLDQVPDHIEYINIESIPTKQGMNDTNLRLDSAKSILKEKYIHWENVNESTENKAHWQHSTSDETHRKQSLNSNEAFTPEDSIKLYQNTSFREKQDGEGNLYTTIEATNIGSQPNNISTNYSKTVSTSNTNYVQYSEKPLYIIPYLKTDLNTKKEQFEHFRVLNNKNEPSKIPNHVEVKDREFIIKTDFTNKEEIHLSNVSAEEDKINSEAEINNISGFSSESSENGLAIELPKNGPKDIINNATLKDEIYDIFADVVEELAFCSNVTKAETPT